MNDGEKILNELLDRYERSGHYMPGKQSNQRISLIMSTFPSYRENDPICQSVNKIVLALAEEGLVTYTWRKTYENWLLDRVYLNLDRVADVYARLGRMPLAEHAAQLQEIIDRWLTVVKTEWKKQFLLKERKQLGEKLRPTRLLPADPAEAENLLKVLAYTENGPELMRVISVNCFQDSKYLERNLVGKLTSIARAYEPELVHYRQSEDELLPQSVVLEQIGIITYPEIFEFCGQAKLLFSEGNVETGLFQKGFCLQSETVPYLKEIDLTGIQRMLFVENRTNYRALVRSEQDPESLIVYHGGFFSPRKKHFFELLASSVCPEACVLFWGDIDLGGFLMFSRLKREVFPQLRPYRMGAEECAVYADSGVRRSNVYLDTLLAYKQSGELDPAFIPAAEMILSTGATIEQEIML